MKLYDFAIPIFAIYILLITITLATEGCSLKNFKSPQGYEVEEIIITEDISHAQK